MQDIYPKRGENSNLPLPKLLQTEAEQHSAQENRLNFGNVQSMRSDGSVKNKFFIVYTSFIFPLEGKCCAYVSEWSVLGLPSAVHNCQNLVP